MGIATSKITFKDYSSMFRRLAKSDKEFAENLVFKNGLRGKITDDFIHGYVNKYGQGFPLPKSAQNYFIKHGNTL